MISWITSKTQLRLYTCINTAWKDVISLHYNGTCTTMCCIPSQSVKQLIPMLMTAPIHYMYYDFPHPFTSLFILQVHVQYMYWYILPYMDNRTSFVDEWTILTIRTAALTSITLRTSSFVFDGGEELTTSLSRMSTLKATIVVCRVLT